MLEKLIARSLGPIIDEPVGDDVHAFVARWGKLGQDLVHTLQSRNGFYSRESALLVRPFSASRAGDLPRGLVAWNEPRRWESYPGAEAFLFFAEDVFGHPFGLSAEGIVSLDLETGDVEVMADTFEDWAKLLDEESNLWTGWTLAHDWQEKNGAIRVGHRLAPRRPFVLGGDYAISNLVLVEEEEGILARARLADQIRRNPVGTEVTYELRPA
jgi:hypothetical protein